MGVGILYFSVEKESHYLRKLKTTSESHLITRTRFTDNRIVPYHTKTISKKKKKKKKKGNKQRNSYTPDS